ncbi:unnamed protein product [Rhodiola kirilowii]
MSILPTQATGTTDLSFSSATQNPNPNHGDGDLLLPPSRRSMHTASLLETNADDSNEPTEKVTEQGALNAEATLTGQDTGNRNDGDVAGQVARGVGSMQSRRKSETTTSSGLQTLGSGNPNSALTNARGRRTQTANGNHLLNFQYDPIARPQPRAPPPRRSLQKLKPYNKDLFLQANYKFVLLDSGNYTPDLTDPDKMFQWEDIICVKYATPSPVHCPICLEHPLCPQITSCGHIFCFPCILQYLLMGKEDEQGESWKRCPLCFVMISPRDLYTIYIENVKQYIVGDTIDLMLLTRQKDSLSVFQKNKPDTDVGELNDDKDHSFFSKFTFTSDVDLSVRQAISDLDSWLVRADSGLVEDIEKLPYVSASLGQLEQRKQYWNSHQGLNLRKPCKDSETQTVSKVPKMNLLAASPDCHKEHLQQTELDTNKQTKMRTAQAEDVVPSDMCDTVLSSSYSENKKLLVHSFVSVDIRDNEYNFYQSVDGQNLILHPLNMRCLLHHYGNCNMLPNRISGRILHLETVTQTEAMRKRYRYLSHFSLTTTFQLCEIDLSKILPPESLAPFMDEIKKRENLRKRQAKKEQKEKVKADTPITEFCMPVLSNYISSSYDEPPFSLDDFEALGSSSVTSSSPPQVGVSPVAGGKMLFSSVTKLGYAAGAGSDSLVPMQQRPEATSSGNASMMSFANVISRESSTDSLASPKVNQTGKKGKKASRVLLSTSGGRRY